MTKKNKEMEKIKYRICQIVRLFWLIPFLLLIATVFVVNREIANGIVSGKYFWFYCTIGLVSVTTTLYLLFSRQVLRLTIIDGLVFLFWQSGLLVSWLNDHEISTKFMLLTLLFPLYIYFRYCFSCNTRQFGYIFLFFLLITGLVEAAWGLGQLYGFYPSRHSIFKITGSLFNPGPYSGYLALVFPVGCYYLIADYRVFKRPKGEIALCLAMTKKGIASMADRPYEKKFNYRLLPFYFRWILSALTATAIIIILPAAMSRASWIAAIIGTAFSCLLWWKRRSEGKQFFNKYKRQLFLLIPILAIFCVGMYFMKKDSADGRALIWKISAKTVVEHPFGVGLGNFSGSYGEQQAAYFASGRGSEQERWVAGNPEYGFNEYFQICIEFGIIPLMVFLSIIVLTFRKGIRNRKYAELGALLSLLIFAFMSYPFNLLPFLIVLVFLLASCQASNNSLVLKHPKGEIASYLAMTKEGEIASCLAMTKEDEIASYLAMTKKGIASCLAMTKEGQCVLTGCVLFMMVFITSICLYNRLPGYKTYKEWNDTKRLYHSGLYKDITDDYERFFPELKGEIKFLFEYAQVLAKSEQYEKSNDILKHAIKISCDPMLYNIMGKNYQALRQYGEAEQSLMKAANMVPNRLYPYYLLAKLYHEMGQPEKLREMADIVMTQKPKVDSEAISEMREELRKLLELN